MWLAASFGGLVAAGLGLRALSRLAAGLDLRLVHAGVADRTAAATTAAHAASVLGRSSLLIPVTAIVGLALVRSLASRAWAPLVAVLGADALQHAVKALVDRPRPAVPRLEHVTGSSFPSGHATESAAVILALAVLGWRRWPSRGPRIVIALAGAALTAAVAISRVYLGVHYPTDVAAGVVLGAAWGAAASRSCASVILRRPATPG